jgi:hypothetical protein
VNLINDFYKFFGRGKSTVPSIEIIGRYSIIIINPKGTTEKFLLERFLGLCC